MRHQKASQHPASAEAFAFFPPWQYLFGRCVIQLFFCCLCSLSFFYLLYHKDCLYALPQLCLWEKNKNKTNSSFFKLDHYPLQVGLRLLHLRPQSIDPIWFGWIPERPAHRWPALDVFWCSKRATFQLYFWRQKGRQVVTLVSRSGAQIVFVWPKKEGLMVCAVLT